MPTWVRVYDRSTGHEYDVPEASLPLADGVAEVQPPSRVTADRPRPEAFNARPVDPPSKSSKPN